MIMMRRKDLLTVTRPLGGQNGPTAQILFCLPRLVDMGLIAQCFVPMEHTACD